jgi:hypothetical protein
LTRALREVIRGSGAGEVHRHAPRRRRELALTELELFDTRSNALRHLELAAVGGISCLLAWLLPLRAIGLAGFAYFLFGVVQGIHGAVAGWRRGKLERRLAARQSAEA